MGAKHSCSQCREWATRMYSLEVDVPFMFDIEKIPVHLAPWVGNSFWDPKKHVNVACVYRCDDHPVDTTNLPPEMKLRDLHQWAKGFPKFCGDPEECFSTQHQQKTMGSVLTCESCHEKATRQYEFEVLGLATEQGISPPAEGGPSSSSPIWDKHPVHLGSRFGRPEKTIRKFRCPDHPIDIHDLPSEVRFRCLHSRPEGIQPWGSS